MKKLLSFCLCLLLAGGLFAQEKFTVPERTPDQKHLRALYQSWSIYAVGIKFAKTHGVSAYDYGKYIGKEFALSWNKEAGFDGFVSGMIYNWESFKIDSDGEIVIIENNDGSVIVKYPAIALSKFFPENDPYASYKEALDCYRGILENIGDYLGCTIVQEVIGESLVITFIPK